MTRTEWGIYEPSHYEEIAGEFNGDVPEWESRLADHDAITNETVITESDLPIGQADYLQVIRDWDTYLAITSEWE